MSAIELPLFPLSTVLYPGGRLDLRIFEPRYLDLVRDCSRSGEGFGVCVLEHGREVGEGAVPARIGTLAKIVDFSATEDGLLAIVARGSRVFRVHRTSTRPNGLIVGEVTYRDDDDEIPVPAEFGLLATILERIAEQVGGELDQADRAKFDDSAWVAYRLAEIIPIERGEQFKLLESTDPIERLRLIAEWLPRFQRH